MERNGAQSLDRVFRPKSIAVVGASSKPTPPGWVYLNLKRDFSGTVLPINPRATEVHGDPAYPSLADIDPVDLVIVLTPAATVEGLVQESVAAGHGSAYVLTAGFGEAGGDGIAAQQRLTDLAAEHGFPIVGPNCIGFMNCHDGVTGNFSLLPDQERPVPGSVGLISQSGGFGSFMLNRAVTGGVGVGMFASTGNEADVTVASVLEYFVEQPELNVVTLFAEAIREPEVLIRAARRAAELDKVIISVTPGGSDEVARAVMSHTASVVGSSEVYDAVCAQYGIVRAESIDSLVETAKLLQGGKRLRGGRIGVITSSGGAGVLVTGRAVDHGMSVPELPAAVQERIGAMLPEFASPRNPVDTTAAIGVLPPETYGNILRELLDCDDIDGVVALTWSGRGPAIDAIVEASSTYEKPVVPVVTMLLDEAASQGIPVFADPTRATDALATMRDVTERHLPEADDAEVDVVRRDEVAALLAEVAGRPFVLESTAKEVLGRYGIPVSAERVCTTAEEAVAAHAELGRPVALKVLSYALPHKSDAGGLVLGLGSAEAVEQAFVELEGRFAGTEVDGYLVQEMVRSRLELALGVHRDPVFGPMVAMGLGGPLIEIIGDPVLLRAPFDLVQANDAVRRIAGGRITHAVRGLDDALVARVAEAAVALGRFAVDHPSVASVDVNPLLVSEGRLVAVDALIQLDPGTGGPHP